MNMRRITSLTAGLSFMLMVLTSIILYIVPQGRVAYWADWRLWGLSKSDWGNLHINLGFLFLVALGLHIYYNWKAITAYLKDKTRRLKVFTPDFNVALVVTLVAAIGTYLMLPPFSWIIALSENIKDRAAVTYGEPPYGHAELSSLKTFTQKLNLDLAASRQMLEASGYAAESDDVTLAALAERYGVPPQQIYQAIQAATKPSPTGYAGVVTLPDSPPPGTGNLLLADFCARYNLDLKQVIRGLNAQAISASAEMSFKQIAAAKEISPTDLYEIIKTLAAS